MIRMIRLWLAQRAHDLARDQFQAQPTWENFMRNQRTRERLRRVRR